MTQIHPTAIIAPGAEIDPSAEVGPYCVVGPQVKLGPQVRLVSHVAVDGITSIGEGTVVYPFASLGHRPQDLKYHGELSRLEIGCNNQIRENVTMNPGTEGGGMLTKVGDNGLFMVGSHVAHDCIVGDNVILANNATLAGHVRIGDHVVMGGLSAVHQFVRIGSHVMVGGMTGVVSDIIPFATVMGNRGWLSGLNLVGIKRRGFNREEIHGLRNAYQMLFTSEGTWAERVEKVATEYATIEPVMTIVDFIRADGSRAICQPQQAGNAA